MCSRIFLYSGCVVGYTSCPSPEPPLGSSARKRKTIVPSAFISAVPIEADSLPTAMDGAAINAPQSSEQKIFIARRRMKSVRCRSGDQQSRAADGFQHGPSHWLRHPLTASRIAPTTVSAAPVHCTQPRRSWRKTNANTIANTTLSLSMGATRDAGPSCNARK